jgi:dTDP-glucose 4,6-dehydratase
MTTFLVTGGAGFIGSALCRRLVDQPGTRVINVDRLTYAGNRSSLRAHEARSNYGFYRADIADGATMLGILRRAEIDVIIHLAAESHVDRSIAEPASFVDTNIVGTFRLLDAALAYWRGLRGARQAGFRFHHVSTDEVFGALPLAGGRFGDDAAYAPSSPYSASKAAADHLVRAWHQTYGLPTILTRSTNNYGPYQYPEKLIPLAILNALEERPIELYGDGANVRDWLLVEDHVRALELVARESRPGESYNVGGGAERSNLAVVTTICEVLDAVRPRRRGRSYRDLITFVADRPGHDRRYGVDSTRIESEFGWRPSVDFDTGLARTIHWYLENEWWWAPLRRRHARSEAMMLDMGVA